MQPRSSPACPQTRHLVWCTLLNPTSIGGWATLVASYFEAEVQTDPNNVFSKSLSFVEPALTADAVARAEQELGCSLPDALLQILQVQNGGTLRNQCFAISFTNSWAPDHVSITALYGLGGERGIDTMHGSKYLTREWGYPPIGVVFAATPSGGHDAFMLDYTDLNESDDPAVVYVDEDRTVHKLSEGFGGFIDGLVDCSEFST